MRNLEKELCGAEPQTFVEGVPGIWTWVRGPRGLAARPLRRNMAAVPGVSGFGGEVHGIRKTWAHIRVHSKIQDCIRKWPTLWGGEDNTRKI